MKDLIERLAKDLVQLSKPDQGLNYEGAHFGKRRYDCETGEPYHTEPRPATLTIYDERAEIVMRLIKEGGALAAALKARLATEPKKQ